MFVAQPRAAITPRRFRRGDRLARSRIMQVEELRWTPLTGWHTEKGPSGGRADLVIYFGDRDALRCGTRFAELRAAYPEAHLVGGSATATILGGELDRKNVVASAIRFANTRIAVAKREGVTKATSRACGEAVGRELTAPDLVGVFVLADGMQVDGSGLTAGLSHVLADGCTITGGMTSDPLDYTEALAGADAPPASGVVAAVGFYGPNIRFSSGHACGWDAFGPRRRITRASGNVLFELDDKPALELYERYIGEGISGGVASGVIFPLLISPPDQPEHAMVRAILGMDRTSGAMTFAGDMPVGWIARLMRGNLDRLALGAADAARQVCGGLPETALGDRLVLMVTCTGRFLLMGQRAVDEIAFARDELGPNVSCLGFYSYGEIAPAAGSRGAELHNQTMTIAALAETES